MTNVVDVLFAMLASVLAVEIAADAVAVPGNVLSRTTNVASASLYQVRLGGSLGPNVIRQRILAGPWVGDAGDWVTAPTARSQAAYDAVGTAALGEGLAVTIAAALVVDTRWQLGRIRYSQWDRELRSVLGNDGGRSHGGGRSR